jgi:hypothetical protein
LILPATFEPTREGGREHDVHFDSASGRWFKFTKPSSCGYHVALVGNCSNLYPATPLQYLERWKIHNSLFSDSVELVGIGGQGYSRRIIVSQPDITGDVPTWEEIHGAFVQQFGMGELALGRNLGGYDARAYFLGRIAVFDVRPANCVKVASGAVVPIDVIPQFFNRRDADILKVLVKEID